MNVSKINLAIIILSFSKINRVKSKWRDFCLHCEKLTSGYSVLISSCLPYVQEQVSSNTVPGAHGISTSTAPACREIYLVLSPGYGFMPLARHISAAVNTDKIKTNVHWRKVIAMLHVDQGSYHMDGRMPRKPNITCGCGVYVLSPNDRCPLLVISSENQLH